jgi:hypothetical protein
MLFILRHFIQLEAKDKQSKEGLQKAKPIQKEKQQTFDEPSFQLPGIAAASAMLSCFKEKQLSVAACHTCDSFLQSDSLPKKRFSEPSKSICAAALSLSLSLCLYPTLNPKIQGKPNGTLCHKIELSIKSPCLWACFHPLSPLSVVSAK